jgi:DHA1 family multidrug resistance protein-like MFS transporter
MALGLANAFLSLGRIAGPLWAGFAFDINLNLPYWSGAVIMLAGFGLSLWALKQYDRSPAAGEERLAPVQETVEL